MGGLTRTEQAPELAFESDVLEPYIVPEAMQAAHASHLSSGT
jgi:hypothetical protein